MRGAWGCGGRSGSGRSSAVTRGATRARRRGFPRFGRLSPPGGPRPRGPSTARGDDDRDPRQPARPRRPGRQHRLRHLRPGHGRPRGRRAPPPRRRRGGRRLHPRRVPDRRPVAPAAVVLPETTAEVSADPARGGRAGASRSPVVGRGPACPGPRSPAPDAVVVSFERMNSILEIDTENHVAVVQPGIRLNELDDALAEDGLVYPVYPGEYSASLGGNVNTNAGGMRAVKYGVTRHHVLGLEVVLPGGDVIRTGGKFVKATSGYDLTQLVVGSEGTLGARHRDHLEAPSPAAPPGHAHGALRSLGRGDRRGSPHHRLRDRPADPRVHRPHDHGRDRVPSRAGARHPPGDEGHGTRLPRGHAGEHPRGPPRGRRRGAGPNSPSSGPLDVYVLPPGLPSS